MDQQPPPKSAIPRRGPPLAAIRTDIAQQHTQRPVLQKPRPQRLRPPEAISKQSESVPLQTEPAKRQTSKTSLRSLFARNKALRDERKQEPALPALGERRGSATPSTIVPDTPRSIAPTVASGSTLLTSSQAATPTESTFRSEKPSDGARSRQEPTSKVAASWAPPPLFQAYPQAVKHARLSIPNISVESVLRLQATQARPSQNNQQAEGDGPDAEAADKNRKEAKDKKTSRRGGTNALDQIVLLKKIFILVTAGYLLQYAGEGSFDRLPEKVMRLGPTSAAFASDAIPGKPYVIHISQKSTDDGKAPATSGRTFLSRFGLQGAESRRAVRTFLMIMPNPQDMNAWLVALRKSIESLGGNKYVAEENGPEFPGSPLLSARNSRLFATRKSSLAESNPASPLSDTFQRRSPVPSVKRKHSYQDEPPTSTTSRSITGPLDTISISNTAAFGDSNVTFENPRNPPIPTQRIRITPSIPSIQAPVDHSNAQPSASTARQLRKPTTSVAGTTGNQRTYIAYSPTQPDQGEATRRPSLGRPLSIASNGPLVSENSYSHPQNTSTPRSASRLSIARKNSSQTVTSEDNNLRQTNTVETPSAVSSGTQDKATAVKTEGGSDSTSNKVKRQSLVSPTQTSTPTIPTRSIPFIPPRKYSLTTSENTTGSSLTSRFQRPPDLSSTSRLSQKSPLPSQSRLPSIAQRSRPANRLQKHGTESETSTSSGSSLARLALGNHRASKALAAPVMPGESATPRSVPALTQQTRKTANSVVDEQEQQQGPQSKSSTPASSPKTPQTPGTPREGASRRTSWITPQSQQTSPRQRRIQNLSLLPPAPPPDCPLPEVPANMVFRLPRPQKRQQQPPPPPPSQQTQLPRPSLPSTPSTQPTPNTREHRRSSELRYLHQQMTNILTRKQSDGLIPTASATQPSPLSATVTDPISHPTSESPLRSQNGSHV